MAYRPSPRHPWTEEQVDIACILRIFGGLSYPDIRNCLAEYNSMDVTTRVIRHKLQIMAGEPEPSEQARRKKIIETDEIWRYWETATVRSLTVQLVLRNRSLLNPPSWRTQIREDLLVVLMLYGGISNERVAQILNKKFLRSRHSAESVLQDFQALEGTEGSWEWWITRREGEGFDQIIQILTECGVDLTETENE